MKNGHGGSSGRPGYAKALTFLLRFNRDTTRSNGFLLYIYIYIWKEEKHRAFRNSGKNYFTYQGIRYEYRRSRRNMEDRRSREESN